MACVTITIEDIGDEGKVRFSLVSDPPYGQDISLGSLQRAGGVQVTIGPPLTNAQKLGNDAYAAVTEGRAIALATTLGAQSETIKSDSDSF